MGTLKVACREVLNGEKLETVCGEVTPGTEAQAKESLAEEIGEGDLGNSDLYMACGIVNDGEGENSEMCGPPSSIKDSAVRQFVDWINENNYSYVEPCSSLYGEIWMYEEYRMGCDSYERSSYVPTFSTEQFYSTPGTWRPRHRACETPYTIRAANPVEVREATFIESSLYYVGELFDGIW